MFPNTYPSVSGPTAPSQTPSFTQAANYINPGLSANQMMQSSPYTQYQQATQQMQQMQQNMKQPGVGAMAMQGQGGQGQPGQQPSVFGQQPQGMQPPGMGGGY